MSNTQLPGDFVNPRVSSPLGCKCYYTERVDGTDRDGVVCAEHAAQELAQAVQAEREKVKNLVYKVFNEFDSTDKKNPALALAATIQLAFMEMDEDLTQESK